MELNTNWSSLDECLIDVWQTDLEPFSGANGQGVGDQQSRVLLLHYVDGGNWNHHLQKPQPQHNNKTQIPLRANWNQKQDRTRLLATFVSLSRTEE